jgi:hypothetical protein
MSSIYSKTDNESIISRINTLTPESKAQWGKMDVAQMLSHCQAPMDVAFGDLSLKANFLISLLGKMMKNKIINAPEFKKNSPTAPAFIRNESCDFQASKFELIAKVSRFANEGKAVIKSHKHPFFGEMNNDEWDKLMWMHLDHHLKQFGV